MKIMSKIIIKMKIVCTVFNNIIAKALRGQAY